MPRRRRSIRTEEPRNIVDIMAREITAACPQAITRMLGLDIAASNLHTTRTTINTRNREVDNLILIKEGDVNKGGIIVEWVSQPDKEDLPDLVAKWADLHAQYRCAMILLVIYLKRVNRATFPDRCTCELNGFTTFTQFTTLKLFEFTQQLESGEWLELTPLLPVCKELDHQPKDKQEEAEAIRVIEASRGQILASDVPEERRNILLGALFSIATKSLTQEQLLEIFRKDINMIQDIPIIRDWLEESRKQGELQAVQRSEAKLRKADEQIRLMEQETRRAAEATRRAEEETQLATESARQSVLAMLQMKFNNVPELLEARIREADVLWCNKLRDKIIVINSLDELDVDTM